MVRSVFCAIVVTFVLILVPDATAQELDIDSALRFEEPPLSGMPHGWGGGPAGTLFFDSTTVHSGRGAARLERKENSPNTFSTFTMRLPADFEGEWIEMHGFLRSESVDGFAGMWLREDGPSGTLQFDNMQDRGIKGSTEWAEYTIRLPLDSLAKEIYFGVLLQGTGTVWADDLQLLVDGKPMSEAPKRKVAPTILDTDNEFDGGSGITSTSFTEAQIANLATLARVWGFLKYHHPGVADGEYHWDYELFRVLPEVLEAEDRKAGNREIVRWVDKIGVPNDCDVCAKQPENTHLLPLIDWIRDADRLGEPLSQQLQSIYKNRFAGEEQFFVTQRRGVGNATFDRELGYENLQPPDPGYRMLALFRLWNIVEYWFPYRDLTDENWDEVLHEFIPRLAGADTWNSYRLELLALIARIQDTHANLWSGLDARPPLGNCFLPVSLREIEDRFVVVRHTFKDESYEPRLQVGDVVEAVDGVPVDTLVADWSPYYAASNEKTRLRDIAQYLPRGECGESTVTIDRDGSSRTLNVPRMKDVDQARPPHDRSGPTFQILAPDVAYLKLSSVRAQDVDSYIEQAADAKGLIVDIRNYPSEFMVFGLGSRFVDEPTPFARFTSGDLSNPGAFRWTDPISISPQTPSYDGKVVVLVDQSSQSQAEYTAMAFRAAPNSVVVGSTTAGADGNVSPFLLPGGLRTMISAIGVFYPDKTPTQRIGILPDIEVEPTLEGFREGRDEVLEAAVRQILGPDVDDETIRRISRRQ